MATLKLNSDGTPVSVLPLSIVSWQTAITDMLQDKVVVLEWYDDWIVHSQNWETKVPAVIMLKKHEKKKTAVRFSKKNVFLRDEYVCQYCGTDVAGKNVTLDHVLPQSHGGKSTFENCVTACSPCNANKGNNHKIVPKFKPYKPSYYQLVDKRKKMGWANANHHPSWKMYLS